MDQLFINYFTQYIEGQESLASVGHIAENTIKTYKNRTNNFKDYLQHTKQEELEVNQVTIRTIRQFESYLRVKKRHCNDYVMRNIQLVKKMLDEAVEDQVITFNPAKHFKFKFERKKKKVFLDLNQLTLLKNCKLPNDDLRRNRDLFLFGCYTGFSYCEIRNFQKKNVKRGSDGSPWINIVRQKTRHNNDTLLPLLSGAQEILDRYGYTLPLSSNKSMNKCLKRISKISGIDLPLSTHSGRKSFGNILVNDFGVDIKTVSVMMGHKSLQTTEAWYVDVRETKIARDMRDVRAVNW